MQEFIVAIVVLLSLIWIVKAISRSIKAILGKRSSCCGCSSCLMAQQCEKERIDNHFTIKKRRFKKKSSTNYCQLKKK